MSPVQPHASDRLSQVACCPMHAKSLIKMKSMARRGHYLVPIHGMRHPKGPGPLGLLCTGANVPPSVALSEAPARSPRSA
jgi:hypothetical protein